MIAIEPPQTEMASSVDLGPKLEAYVESLMQGGRYNSKSQVLREGVRLVQEREARLTELDAAIARGIADVEAGRVVDEVRAHLRERFTSPAQRKRA